MALLLHAADLGAPLQAAELDRKLAQRVSQEFGWQAQAERAAGVSVTVLDAGTALGTATMEIGFVMFIVRPLFVALARAVPELAALVNRVDASVAMWSALRAQALRVEGPRARQPPQSPPQQSQAPQQQRSQQQLHDESFVGTREGLSECTITSSEEDPGAGAGKAPSQLTAAALRATAARANIGPVWERFFGGWSTRSQDEAAGDGTTAAGA